MQFDEKVHLASIGGGFLRTPYLTSTQDPALYPRPDQCPVLSPQIIHIPAAGRKSGLNLQDPSFRRAVLSSSLCKRLTRDGSAQANQEAAGITFGFSDSPDRNVAHARLGSLSMGHEKALFLDDAEINEGRPIDVNTVPSESMTTGFLAFISRYWQELRHIDHSLLLEHRIPLQFDCDFDIIPVSSMSFRAYIPILGNLGSPIVYDPAHGPSSFIGDTAPIGDNGSATIIPDGNGGYFIDLTVQPQDTGTVSIAIADQAGQVYSRTLIIQDGFPAGAIWKLPHAMVGVPYFCSLTYLSGVMDPATMVLPAGLSIDRLGTRIHGTPIEYGTNFGNPPVTIIEDGMQQLGVSLTVNRPPRLLLAISDVLNNDESTGEYYAAQFMPFGSILTYGGDAYEFRRFADNTQPWPIVKQVPYLYNATTRQSAREQEQFWKAAP